jgi:hypothetical protein
MVSSVIPHARKNERCAGGRRTALSCVREEGDSLTIGTTPGEGSSLGYMATGLNQQGSLGDVPIVDIPGAGMVWLFMPELQRRCSGRGA